jgi:uncharacterized protein
MEHIYLKLENLKAIIASLDSVAIAFSGGVDSTLLIRVAYDVLGDKAIAVTARSSAYPVREFNEAAIFAESLGIRHVSCNSEELDIAGFADNPPNRCYLCKKSLMAKIRQIADLYHLAFIIEGSNLDDDGDFRPGLQAIKEADVRSPLMEAGLTKEEIRRLSREMALPTWDKPSFACLSSRFPYGEAITREKLTRVDQAEQWLLDLGFKQVRVRNHQNLARIEIDAADFQRLMDASLREAIHNKLKAFGYDYVAIDLKGYRTGSMNEALTESERQDLTTGDPKEASHAR